MRAKIQDQKSLLAIAELDLEAARIAKEIAAIRKGQAIEKATEELLQIVEEFNEARRAVAELELELERNESDLKIVENRIAKDTERLASTSNAKDAQGTEHELLTLAKRKSELEDLELGTMERLESANAKLDLVQKEKQTKELQIESLKKDSESGLAELESKARDIASQRTALVARIDPALMQSYTAKSQRGTAIARLQGRDCGACRLSLTATGLEEINSLPPDDLATCPNCQAYLVRS